MLDVPPPAPVTSPVDAFTVATALSLLVHVPPGVPLVASVVVAPAHIIAVPVIVPGVASGFTVTVTVPLLVQLSELVPVTVYVVVIVGLAVIDVPVVADKPAEGDQL